MLDFHSCFQIKDLITVFTEDEPSVKIPDLLGMGARGGVCGLKSVLGHLKTFNSSIKGEINYIVTERCPVGYSESVKFICFLLIFFFF